MADGMLKTDATGMKRDTAVGKGTGCAVLQVTTDGEAYVGELATYLMVAAGVEMNLHELVAVAASKALHVENGLLGIGARGIVGVGLVLLSVAGEIVVEGNSPLPAPPLGESPFRVRYLAGSPPKGGI